MMNRKEFYEYVKDNVKEYLPESYKDAEIKLQEVEKNNGLKLTGITIPNGNQRIVPTVYLDSLYQEYINGKDVDSCVGDVADMRIEAQGKAEFFDMGVPDILDYEKMKDKLQVRICDKEWNTDRLADKVVTEHGDFAAYYAVNLEENGEGISSIPVTVSLMNEWGVSVEQIQADAMMADKNRGVQLVDMTQIVESMIFGGTPKNLLNEKLDMETVENPMFCLTNESKMNGASLLLQEDIRKQIGECLGSDYFVIPSSVHEVLILPDNGIFQVPELNAMVQEVNETQVERQEQLSDKVQFCDKKTAVMENAERREARLEKEKAAEKAEVKGGIHGKLEKAKAEIKAKEPDAVTVFIGPCLAKKSEVVDQKIPGNADYVLTYSEIRAIMKARDVVLQPCENKDQEASAYGKRFANSGGVTAAVLQSLKESDQSIDAKVCVANGAAECKKALLLLKAARLPEDFIEGMACEGVCGGGPSSFNDQFSSKKNREALLGLADDRGIHQNLENYDMSNMSMHRE